MTETKKVLEGDVIWSELKDQPVNVFGFLGKLSDYVSKIASAGEALFIRPKAPAVMPELDRLCFQDAIGNRAETPKYNMVMLDDGSLSITRGVSDKSTDQETSCPEVVEGSVLMSAPPGK